MKIFSSLEPRVRGTLIIVILLAVLLRLFFFLYVVHDNNQAFFYQSDSHGYIQLAENMVAGHGFSMSTTSPYLPDSIRVPIVPLLIAVCIFVFHSSTAFLFFQMLLSAFLAVVVFFTARLFVKKDSYALLAAAFTVFEPFSVFIHLQVLTEVVFTVFVAIGAYYAFRYIESYAGKYIALASMFFGLAALTRPIGEFLPFLLVLLVLPEFRSKTILKKIALALIPFLLVVSPWVVRNYEAFHTVGLSSGGFQNVYSDLGGTIISLRDHIEWYKAKAALEEDFAARHHVPRSEIQQNLSLSPILFKEGVLIAIHNPIPTVLAVATVAVAFFTNDLWSYYFENLHFMPLYTAAFSPSHSLLTDGPVVTFEKIITIMGPTLIVPLLGRLFWVGICLLFVFGLLVLWKQGRMQRMSALFALAAVLYFFALSVSNGAGINGRYRYPVSPILFAVAFVGLERLLTRKGNIEHSASLK